VVGNETDSREDEKLESDCRCESSTLESVSVAKANRSVHGYRYRQTERLQREVSNEEKGEGDMLV
jgi:hypothetical protein